MPTVKKCHSLKCFYDSGLLLMKRLFTGMTELHLLNGSVWGLSASLGTFARAPWLALALAPR